MTKILFFGDNDTTTDAVEVLDAMKKEQNVDQYVFLGDGPYDKSGVKWVSMMKPFFPDTSKLMITQGNHEHEESESAKTEADIEAWIPSLKETPEPGGDQSWEKTKWISSKKVGDVFIMCMNSQDLDVEFKRNQYNWVLKTLGKAAGLQKAGQINWIINAVHKPWFTLKSSHSPYTAVREIYSDLFKGMVDMNWHGHNHNDQAWFPMIAMNKEGNAAGEPLYTLMPDKKTLDYSKPHGFLTNIQGHSGHEHNPFKENAAANKNVQWSNDKVFSYSVLETSGKKANIKWKDVAGKVLFEYNISKEGSNVTPTPPPPPPPDTPKPPPTAPPGPGFKFDPKSNKWIPILEHPSFVPKKDDEEKPTPTPTPPATTDGSILWDSNIHLKTGKKYTITDTYGDQKPNGKGIFMAASGSPRVHVEPDGTFYLEADAGHGRMYIKATNYNARLEGELMFMDEAIRNTTLRLRCRHNEGGGEGNNFGGFGATVEREEQLAEYSTEPYHNVHENSVKKPLTKPIELNKWLKFKYSVQDAPGGKEVLFNTQYDYNDGKGWVTVLTGKHSSPKPYYLDKALYEKESYAWLRINNEKTGKIGYRNVRIIKL